MPNELTRSVIITTPCTPELLAGFIPHAAIYASQGLSAVWWIDEEPILAWGVHRLWLGVGIAWMVVRNQERLQAGGLPLWRRMKRQQDAWWQAEPWRWVESSASRDDLPAQRFLGWLGFRVYAQKEGFGPQGETALLYVNRGTRWNQRNGLRLRGSR